jgi:septal ring factor EnvC (AmiA/AmiB activator)
MTTNSSVRGTNTKTWIIAGVAALFAILAFFRDCGQDRQSKRKQLQLQEQLRDSSRQIRETLQSDVRRIEDSLKKISGQMTKFNTTKTPTKPKPTDKPN